MDAKTLWYQLGREAAICHKEIAAAWAVRDYQTAESFGYRLLELLRMSKRWKANGNTPPNNLGGLTEDKSNADHEGTRGPTEKEAREG